MIYPEEFENGRFVDSLSMSILKINFIASAIRDHKYANYCGLFDGPEDFEAVGDILSGIADELKTIHCRLYPESQEAGEVVQASVKPPKEGGAS